MKFWRLITLLTALTALYSGHLCAKENPYRVSPTEQLHQKLLKLYKLKSQDKKSFDNIDKVNSEIETLVDQINIDSSEEKEFADDIVENNFTIN